MQICYECLEKQCTQQEIVLWKSDFLYSMAPKRCGFCGERGPVVEGVRLHTLGSRRLLAHLYKAYEATVRAPLAGAEKK
ncbi:MAG: hypothetical protein J6L72_09160 [Butyricicoccus sp.]|nr:hypothetical protein [Butyricicoccus sp.]